MLPEVGVPQGETSVTEPAGTDGTLCSPLLGRYPGWLGRALRLGRHPHATTLRNFRPIVQGSRGYVDGARESAKRGRRSARITECAMSMIDEGSAYCAGKRELTGAGAAPRGHAPPEALLLRRFWFRWIYLIEQLYDGVFKRLILQISKPDNAS